jgi:hypothetical protein
MSSSLHEKEQFVSDITAKLQQLLDYITSAAGNAQIHTVEKEIFRQTQQIGLLSLQLFVKESGTGYEANNPVISETTGYLKYKVHPTSPYLSIFGELSIERAGYYDQEKGTYCYPIDKLLNLPETKYSYLLTDWLLSRSTDTDYREAVKIFNEFFDLDLSQAVPQRLCDNISQSVQDYYNQSAADYDDEGTHLVLSADGKGVPIRKSERSGDEHKVETPKARRAKGEKPGVKKEATVAVGYSFNPVSRTAQDIVSALMHEYQDDVANKQPPQEQQAPRIAQNKHYRASLSGKDCAIGLTIEQLLKRDSDKNKRIVVLMDGAPSLEKAMKRMIKQYQLEKRVDTFILDIIHACEYVWEAGTAIYGERNSQRQPWVREKLVALLEGRVGYVIGALKQIIKKNKLCKSKMDIINKVIGYFSNHKHMMRYDQYLAKGYPIGTGVVESACGSLVKNRMERNGMRWSMQGAQAMLDLRAVKMNHDWKHFMDYYIKEQEHKLYADNYKRKLAA